MKRTRLPKKPIASIRESRLSKMFESLHDLTDRQDRLNISIIKTLDEDTDPRWIPLHMMDNANAILLHISRNKGKPSAIDELYLKEKIQGLNDKYAMVRWG